MTTPFEALRWHDVPMAVIDLEMTGLDPAHDRIVEVGVVRAVGGVVVAELGALIRADRPMTSDARRITGIRDADLVDAPPFAAVAPELLAILDGAAIVAHRGDMDHAFLSAAFAPLSRSVPVPAFDTLVMARNLLSLRSHALQSLCDALGIERPEAHRALADARATWAVFRALVNLVDPEAQLTLGELAAEFGELAAGTPRRSAHRRALEAALRARRTVWIEYVGRDEALRPAITRREVAVWSVQPPHLSGYCYLREEHRVFRIDRIRGVEPGGGAYELPDELPPLRRR